MKVVLAAVVAMATYQAPRVTPAAVAARSDVLFVDTRSKEAYDAEHIYGAVNAPNAVLDRSTLGLSRSKTLVLYCTCPAEHGSLVGAAKLHDRWGYTKLAVLQGGLDAWREAGYQVTMTHKPQPSAKPMPSPHPTTTPKPQPTPTPTTEPTPAPDQRDPMDERGGNTP
jgi:rhodanese-related sulfurtransferase